MTSASLDSAWCERGSAALAQAEKQPCTVRTVWAAAHVKAGLPLRADRVRRELSAEVSALRHSANKPLVVRWPDFGQKKPGQQQPGQINVLSPRVA